MVVAPIGAIVLITGITEATLTPVVITADGAEATTVVVIGEADQTRTTTVNGTEVTRIVATGVANVQIIVAMITGAVTMANALPKTEVTVHVSKCNS